MGTSAVESLNAAGNIFVGQVKNNFQCRVCPLIIVQPVPSKIIWGCAGFPCINLSFFASTETSLVRKVLIPWGEKAEIFNNAA